MSRYLLDTHVWLWLQTTPERVRPALRSELARASSTLFLSVVSAWEIAIKHRLGKLALPEPPERYVPQRLRSGRYDVLPVALEHVLETSALESHHADPFDRLLVAQARVEGLTLVTADPDVAKYDVTLERA